MARRTEKTDAIDKYIGQKIRELRDNVGMTQSDLASFVGVSYQQIHKYELGTNRISAGRLGIMAKVLRVSIQTFFEDTNHLQENGEQTITFDNPLCREIARNFRQIHDLRHQQALHLLVRVLANSN